MSVHRGYRVRVTGAEIVELVEVRGLWLVHLVGHQQPGLAAGAQHVGDATVARVQPGARVDHEQQEIRLGDGLLHLPPDLDVHRVLRVLHDAAGIDEPEVAPRPVGSREVPVARGARFVGDDRGVATDDAVEQRRLADVGPPDQGDDRDIESAHRAATMAASRL
jgi:hypothetical protein